jgi:hypothetical protein
MSTSTEERRSGGVATHQVEYQMRFREIIARAGAQPAAEFQKQQTVGPFLTVSREAGSEGAEVARRVGARLGWAVLDKELVDHLANDLKLEPRALSLMDETRADWFSETLLNLFNSRLVEQRAYVELLGKVVALAAASEPVVIVGRGAHLILPTERGLRVRVTAPRKSRIEAISRAEGLDLPAAEKRMEAIDADRSGFVRRNFRSDATDASHYDLVLNAGTLGVDGCVEVIIRSLEVRKLI